VALSQFTIWLAETPWSVALRESLYAYTWIGTAHLLALTLFVGTVWMVDLRLLGLAFRETALPRFSKAIFPWSLAGFVVIATSGLLLFYANPVRTYHSFWMRVKLLLILAAGLNAAIFHLRQRKGLLPRYPGLTGAISLMAWISAIAMGRLIAMSWFDCERGPPTFVAWFAQCSSLELEP